MSTNTYNTMMRDFVNMANAMNRSRAQVPYDYARNGGSSAGQPNGAARIKRSATLPINAWMQDDTYFVTANLPGVNPEDVELTFEGDDLTIRGNYPAEIEKSQEKAGELDEDQSEEKVEFIRHELYSGPFERKIGFNVPVDADNIEAVFENGMLKLSIPKAEEAKPKQIKVLAK